MSSRLTSKSVIVPLEKEHILQIVKSLPQTNHKFIINYPIRDSAIAAVKKHFTSTNPDLVRRFQSHFSQMCKLKDYGLMEVKLKEYNMTIVFNSLKNDLEEMTYTVDNLDFKPCVELAKKGFLSSLFKRS